VAMAATVDVHRSSSVVKKRRESIAEKGDAGHEWLISRGSVRIGGDAVVHALSRGCSSSEPRRARGGDDRPRERLDSAQPRGPRLRALEASRLGTTRRPC
jgi:hypothetical protein